MIKQGERRFSQSLPLGWIRTLTNGFADNPDALLQQAVADSELLKDCAAARLHESAGSSTKHPSGLSGNAVVASLLPRIG
jgi:hypothetical protein